MVGGSVPGHLDLPNSCHCDAYSDDDSVAAITGLRTLQNRISKKKYVSRESPISLHQIELMAQAHGLESGEEEGDPVR